MQDSSGTEDFLVLDAVTDLEARFPFAELLAGKYFQKYRSAYDKQRELGVQARRRSQGVGTAQGVSLALVMKSGDAHACRHVR